MVRLGQIAGEGLDFLGFTMRYERSILPHLRRRSQRGCRPGKGISLYAHLYPKLGLEKLRNLR